MAFSRSLAVWCVRRSLDDSIFATMMDDLHVLQLDEVQRCRYFELLGLAVRCQAGGVLRTKGGPLDLDLLSSRLKISYDELVGTLFVLTNVGLVDYQGDAWLVPAGTRLRLSRLWLPGTCASTGASASSNPGPTGGRRQASR